MLFNSLKFAAFFPAVTLGYFVLPHRLRVYWLLAASYLFYMCWNPRYALLMLASTGITWAAGLAMGRAEKRWKGGRAVRLKKWAVGLSLAANLAILFLFKYAGFLLENLNALRVGLGLERVFTGFSLLLPVGISFYVFQAVGYTIDVYRGDIPPEKSFCYYALFVSFFPQLVAGPIERSRNMLPQLHAVHRFDYERAKSGLVQMLWGYIQKLVIADRLALLVDAVYGNSAAFGAPTLLLAALFFAIQLYCDFSSYSDIAIGAARVMGFELMRNFDSPYLAASLGEFWDTWHISLSKWFQDYLYIPLGGSRRGLARTCLNLLIVFLVSGLWHGAAWTFLVWGGLHGVYSVLSRLSRPQRAALCSALRIHRSGRLHRVLCTAWTFGFVCLTLVFFRADSISAALAVFRGFGRWDLPFTMQNLGLDGPDLALALVAVLALLVCDILRKKYGALTPRLLQKPLWVQWAVLLAGILTVVVFGMYGEGYVEQPFIYFQF